MTTALATTALTTPTLRVLPGRATSPTHGTWWARRAFMRTLVGGCPDHWWTPTARRTAACTCDRFGA